MGNFIFRVHVGYSKAVIDVSAVTKKAFLFASKLILCFFTNYRDYAASYGSFKETAHFIQRIFFTRLIEILKAWLLCRKYWIMYTVVYK